MSTKRSNRPTTSAPVAAAGSKKRYGKSSAEKVYGQKPVDSSDDTPHVVVNPPKDPRKERLYLLIENPDDTDTLSAIRRLADLNLGMQEVVLVMKKGEEKRPLKMPFKVDANEDLIKKLKDLLGEEKVKVK